LKPIAAGLFAVGFHFEVETIEVIESVKFFFRPGSAEFAMGEHDGAWFNYYAVTFLTAL